MVASGFPGIGETQGPGSGAWRATLSVDAGHPERSEGLLPLRRRGVPGQQVTGPEKDGAARGGGGVGSWRRWRRIRPEQQAERGESRGQRRRNEKQTQIGKCSHNPRQPGGAKSPGSSCRGTRGGPGPPSHLQTRSRRATRGTGTAWARKSTPSPLTPALSRVSLRRRKAPPRLGDTPRPVLEYWVGLFV